ncbi:AMP-binding protein [Cryptosporangium arvum]|uniref:AMP-binding protein n=1 Tax=Cryptosporangium arvum TaxID=80871 RepID=UPI0004B0D75A|nr:AMP-binding protein [Cryptosporangium arvum]
MSSPSNPVADAVANATSLADLLRATARRTPDAPAVVGDGRNVTHGELDRRSNALARGLIGAGLQPGDRVAYLARNATEYWELFFAAAKAGLVIVPMNFRLAAPEVEWILGDVTPAALLVEEHLVPASFDGLQLVLGSSYEDFLAAAAPHDPHRDSTGDDLFSIMYSSGTTGRPKGVTTTVAGFLWAVGAFGPAFDVSSASVSLVPTPYYHIAAGGWSLIALAAGGRIVQFTEVTPAGLIASIVGHRATHVIMVPTVMQLFLSSPEASAADYSSVEWVVYGGSPISESVMVGAQRVFGAKLAQSYGLTETIGVTTILGADDHVVGAASKLRSAGRAVPGVEVAVADPATGAPVAPGTTGEVVTRGPAVTPGYWKRGEAGAYWPGGWFRTGDAGYLDEDGYLFLKDRIKDMISSGGENVYPAEVENAIMAHPDVLEVAVIGVPSDRWGETPLAVVVPRPGAALDADALIEHCRAHLAHYKCPTAVEVVADLPRNPSGKLLKRQLREPYWAGQERAIS